MIAFFPGLYPDELIYSQLARYYLKSGYTAYTYAAQDLYARKNIRPDPEFLNSFTTDALNMITKNVSMHDIIMKHTMFPFYGRFMENERRKNAYRTLINVSGNYRYLLAVPKTNQERFLQFCPECVKSDREICGETYWHRIHQMTDADFCCVHNCRLIESGVIISGRVSPNLITAEECVNAEHKSDILCSETERKLNNYILNVMNHEINFENDVLAGDYISSKIHDTKYEIHKKRNMALLTSDYNVFYKTDTELWRLQKILTNKDFKLKNVCMLAMFLNIEPDNLCNPVIDYKMTKTVRINKSNSKKSGVKVKNWGEIDKFNLPKVREAIDELNKVNRPQKITFHKIEKMLSFSSKQLNHMPNCRAEILKYRESQQQYWTRKIQWALQVISLENQPLNWKHIRDLTNMRKKDVVSCLSYLPDDVREKIKKIFGGCK